MRKSIAVFLLLLVIGIPPRVFAAETFVVSDMRLEGLQRISAGTVFNYLPVKVGDRVDKGRAAEAIRALFKTGFFKDVRVEGEGSTLVISVVERPSIASISLSGNSDINTEELLESLKQIGFAEGRVFNPSLFDQVEQELRRSYFSLGKYGVQIEKIVTPMERNRVAVQFNISEGKVARIKQINIVGNEVFSDKELLKIFELTSGRWHSFLTKKNQYSKQKLGADLESMRSHYLNNGYINFSVDSTQVSLTPSKEDVYVTINVTEGDQFTVSDVALAGDLVVPREDLMDKITVNTGEVFSRETVTQSSKNLTERFGDDGYAFANVNAIPDIDEEKKEVNLTFFADPGKRVYVRRINFEGNSKSRDEVLRREMRQMEGAWISTGDVERSRVRLERLGFFQEVNIETPAVPGTTDQVDINVSVVERPSGNILAGAGFSQSQGVLFQGSISQENFLGTGNRVSATLNNSSVNRTIAFSYLNPYYTMDGVSRGFHVRYREVDAAEANISEYVLDEISAGVTFGIPVTEFDAINLGFTAKQMDFNEGYDISEEVREFANEVDGRFSTFLLSGSWARDSRNRKIFPDSGSFTYAGAEVGIPGGDLTYYKLTGKHQRFFPLPKDYVLMLNGEVGYGDGYGDTEGLPIIENFYAGGIRSVRGFEANTLGPRETKNNGDDDDPLGGSLKLEGNAEVIIPAPFIRDIKSTQLSGFVDAGNVYGPDEDVDFGTIRYSAGIATTWMSPFGALTFSYAVPIRKEPEDQIQKFQFTFGASFQWPIRLINWDQFMANVLSNFSDIRKTKIRGNSVRSPGFASLRAWRAALRCLVALFAVACLSSAPMAAEIKVGYVDTSLVMQKAPQAESAAHDIEQEFSPRDKELSSQQKEIAKLEDKLARDGDLMSDKDKRELVKRIRLLKRERRRLQDEFREEFTMRRNELQNELTLIIIQAIREVAKKENFDLVIDSAVYAGKRVDITEKVVALLAVKFQEQEK